MTLTYPMINRSRRILWLVTGNDKFGVLRRLLDGDQVDSGWADESGPGRGDYRPGGSRTAQSKLTQEMTPCASASPPITAGSA